MSQTPLLVGWQPSSSPNLSWPDRYRINIIPAIKNGTTIDKRNHYLLFYSYTVRMHECITVNSVTTHKLLIKTHGHVHIVIFMQNQYQEIQITIMCYLYMSHIIM